jgi:hypothetical protein
VQPRAPAGGKSTAGGAPATGRQICWLGAILETLSRAGAWYRTHSADYVPNFQEQFGGIAEEAHQVPLRALASASHLPTCAFMMQPGACILSITRSALAALVPVQVRLKFCAVLHAKLLPGCQRDLQ